MTDPRHPLFGRRFGLLTISSGLQGGGYVVVGYRQQMSLRIPLAATNLAPVRPQCVTKLTISALTELIEVAEQCEVIWSANPTSSGSGCQRPCKTKFSTI